MYLEPETDAKNEGCNAGDEPAEEGVEREGPDQAAVHKLNSYKIRERKGKKTGRKREKDKAERARKTERDGTR